VRTQDRRSCRLEKAISLKNALTALKRVHFCIITTEYGKAFTVDGFA
jgi:hypothetical protein